MEIFLLVISLVIIILLWLPNIKIPHWTIAGQEYLKVYYLSAGFVIGIIAILFLSFNFWNIIILLLLFLSILYQVRNIIIYTPLYKKELTSAAIIDERTRIKILIFNVYQPNSNFKDFLQLVENENPDVICLLETNKVWDDGIKSLKSNYPYCIKKVLENTYGMICYSRIKWSEAQVLHFNKEDIPSIEMLFELGAYNVRLLVLHPEPPIYGEAETALPKRKEIVRAGIYLAQKIEKGEKCILVGDLNDVAWSRSANLFRVVTGMKDPRVGRGLYSTFPAYFYFKIPLDQVFVSPSFEVNDFKTLRCAGSDHLPVLADLQLKPE